MPLPLKNFYMIRHGETEANASRTMAGSIDSPLTQRGRDQAKEAGRLITAMNLIPAAIFHSSLSRARDTALIINETLNINLHEDADLREIHAGEWEGLPYEHCEELLTTWPIIPEAEKPEEFFERVKRGKIGALNRYDDPILIVCHGGVMRAFGALYGLNTPGNFANAHLYEFKPNPTNESFPWTVFGYSFDGEGPNVKRSISPLYHEE